LIRELIRSDCVAPTSFVLTRLARDIIARCEHVHHGVHGPHPQVDVPLHFSTENHFILSSTDTFHVAIHQTVTIFVPVICKFELPINYTQQISFSKIIRFLSTCSQKLNNSLLQVFKLKRKT
uniref:Secreted protein n=1 Tax=Elaeophora elaphi TaxID=1147741 RepID=A0A0R3RW53_9BILA